MCRAVEKCPLKCQAIPPSFPSQPQTHQALGHGGLVPVRQVLLQCQDDAVGNDGGQDHVLERSEGQRSRKNMEGKKKKTRQTPRSKWNGKKPC